MTSEKNFQNYFMKTVDHGYRTALIAGGGFPDLLLINGEQHSLVELKILPIGPSGDKKLAGLFKPTQLPWYYNYLKKGGKRLFVVFRLENSYGVLHVNQDFLDNFATVKYSTLCDYCYNEYKTLKELLNEHFS